MRAVGVLTTLARWRRPWRAPSLVGIRSVPDVKRYLAMRRM